MKEINLEKYKTLAERYTKALLEIATKNNIVSDIGNELKSICDLFEQNNDIAAFYTNPIIKNEDKKEVLEKSFNGKINENLYNFLCILLDKNRIFILPNIQNLYTKKLNELNNILSVEVQTAIEPDEDIINSLRNKLENLTGKNIRIINNINKDIIGGMILNINGKIIDGSIKTQLKELQKQLV